MSAGNTGQETRMPIKDAFSNSTDYIRMVIGSVSSRVTPINFVNGIIDLISAGVAKSKIRTIVTNSAITIEDNTVLCDCTSGNISTPLPSASSMYDATSTKSITLKIVQQIDAGNTVTISPAGAESIYDSGSAQTSIGLVSGASVSIESNGVDYIVVGS
jgi:hypothetical protein